MSLESPALVDALVAWSAGHLASRDSRYRCTALEARSNSLRSLATSLASSGSASEINAAISLILMTSEVCLGLHTNWYSHLSGTKQIIMAAQSPSSIKGPSLVGPDALKQTSEGQWILRNFAYHDVLGSVTLGTKPLIQSQYLAGITDVVDTYLGVASGILASISYISCLEGPTLVHDFIRCNEQNEIGYNCFMLIEQKLKTWVCSSGTSLALASLAYTYRHSALIYLYRRIIRALNRQLVLPEFQHQHFIRDLHWKIQSEVLAVVQHVKNIPLNEIVESALLFPLFMAGCETKESVQMDFFAMRLDSMLRKRHFHNIQQAWDVLREIWERRRGQNLSMSDYDDLDWEDVVKSQEKELLLT
jgi:hypothetical protein